MNVNVVTMNGAATHLSSVKFVTMLRMTFSSGSLDLSLTHF